MPKTWDAAQERLLLMTVISTVDTKPSSEHWAQIAGVIGDGLTASAVSYDPHATALLQLTTLLHGIKANSTSQAEVLQVEERVGEAAVW